MSDFESRQFCQVKAHDVSSMTVFLAFKGGVSMYDIWMYVTEHHITLLPVSISKTSVDWGSDFKIGSYSLCSASCYFISITLILIFVNLYACRSAILYVFVLHNMLASS